VAKPAARTQTKATPAAAKKAAKPVARAAATAVATKTAPVDKGHGPAAAKNPPAARQDASPAKPAAKVAAMPAAAVAPATKAATAKATGASHARELPDKAAHPAKPEPAAKGEHPAKPEPAARSEHPAKAEPAARPEQSKTEHARPEPAKAEHAARPDQPARPAPRAAEPAVDDEPQEAAPVERSGGDMPRRPGGPGMHQGPITTPRPMAKAEIFHEGDHVVYPTHGVGKVERIAIEEIAGHKLELIHITFEENRMTLRVPVAKARTAGLRKLATRKLFDEALNVLKGRARIKRTMWSRRAQEYEAKINSGDPLAIAEVVRDLHRNAGQPDQSFSERQIYEAAMERLAAELAALDKTDKLTAATKLTEFLKTV
jgi:CarD family transcriptional regulator